MAKRKPKPVKIPKPADIIKVREDLGLDQAEAAERVGTTQGQWSNWETGKRKPSRQAAMLIELLRQKKI